VEDSRPAESKSVTALILAGGFGTRSSDPTLPKVLQNLDPFTKIIDVQLVGLQESGFSRVNFLLGHNSDQVISYIEKCRAIYPSLEIGYFVEKVQQGTRISVSDALGLMPNSNEFLLILGDTVTFAPLGGYVRRWLDSSLEFAILCHPNLHMEDSDLLGLDENGRVRSYVEKGSGGVIDRGLLQVAATGAMFFTRRAFKSTSTSETDVTKALVKS
jgi:NDP-sugar pyrophosphorylase family protein